MPVKGSVHTPNFVTEKVLAVVAAITSEEFTTSDIYEKIEGLTRNQVGQCLKDQIRRKALDRGQRGRYRKGGLRIQTKLPHGLLAEAVWATLFTSKNSMRLLQIVGEAESYIGRADYSARNSVGYILICWYRYGYLERSGKYGEYAYTVKPGVTERPLTHLYPQ